MKYLLAKFVPDAPHAVGLQLDRQVCGRRCRVCVRSSCTCTDVLPREQKYLTDKHMLGEADDITTALDVAGKLSASFEADVESKRTAQEHADMFEVAKVDPNPWPVIEDLDATTVVNNELYRRRSVVEAEEAQKRAQDAGAGVGAGAGAGAGAGTSGDAPMSV